MSKSKIEKSFIFLFRSAVVGFGDVLAVGLMSVGMVRFVTNMVVVVVVVRDVVVVEVVIDIGGGGFDKCGYGWICD